MNLFNGLLKKPQVPKLLAGAAIVVSISLSSCGTSEPQYVEEQQIVAMNNGVVTEVEEVSEDLFKIANETVVDKVEDSRIIAQYLDGARDTFTLEEAKLVDANDNSEGGRRRSMIGSVVQGGLIGYFMGRSLSSSPNPRAYKNSQAYSSATAGNSKMKSNATSTTVRKPVRSKSGFGKSSGSTRSYGG